MRLDPIVIGPYDQSWPASFAAQRSRVTPVLQPWLTRDIEHIEGACYSVFVRLNRIVDAALH